MLNKVRNESNAGQVVFTYHTQHADSERDAGDRNILRPHRWSNDSRTYTIQQNQYVVPSHKILTDGRDSPPFGFYDFGGGRVLQQNRGVVWLTDYDNKDRENASRPKMKQWGKDKLLVLWKKWTLEKHIFTHAQVIDSEGRKKSGVMRLGPVRITPGQRLFESGELVFGVTSNGRELEVLVIERR